MDEEREEISLEKLAQQMKAGKTHLLDQIQVRGTAVIRDKDGNVKSTLELTNLED